MKLRKIKNPNAITLIALVITIIVLLILAGVALSLVFGEDGITEKAITAAKIHDIASAKEKIELLAASYAGDFYQEKYITGNNDVNSLGDYVASRFTPGTFEGVFTLEKDNDDSRKITIKNNNPDDNSNNSATYTISDDGQVVWEEADPVGKEPIEEGTLIDNNVNYKGYFADLNGDGKIEVDKDGVIYVDLLVQSETSGSWGQSYGEYAIPKASSAESYKKYIISGDTTSLEGQSGYGAMKMIKLSSNTSGNPRFYVMALQDLATGDYETVYWYKNATDKMNSSDTSDAFGTGKTNTQNMLNIWNGENGKAPYATQHDQDLWKFIGSKFEEGWFVPSRAEWSAFGASFPMCYDSVSSHYDYGIFGLSKWYWSSSQHNVRSEVYYTSFDTCGIYHLYPHNEFGVRLSTIF